jgi:2'-5' RNA ligase
MYQGNNRRENYNRGDRGGRGGFGGRRPYGNRPQQHQQRRNPLPEGFSLFYVAVVCPDNIEAQVADFKKYMEDKYGCRAASKSPAHITIVPPFRAEDEIEKNLLDFVNTYNMGVVPFDIQLKGYNQFADRVLFIDVTPNEQLNSLEQECMTEFTAQFPSIIFGVKPPFNPHVTIATRDIPEGRIGEARNYFETNHPFDTSFEARELKLFKLDRGWWKVC